MSPAKTFFSYCRSDESFALRLAQDLRQAGIPIWFDQLDIPAGRRWDSEIQKALGTSDSLLVVLSPGSVASENVMDEVSYALDQNKHVIPVLHQPCDVPLRIRRLQYIDFTSNYEAGLTHLLRVLRQAAPEDSRNSESVSHPPAGIMNSGRGIQPESTVTTSTAATRKPLLYGAGAIGLALVIFLVYKIITSLGKNDVNEEGTESEMTTNNNVAEDSVSNVDYTFSNTDLVAKPTADSVLQKMNSYVDATENQTVLPKTLNYELTYEDECYEFYIKMGKGTVLPDEWMKTIKSFGSQLKKDLFEQRCLKVGAWDYINDKWEGLEEITNEQVE